MDNTTNPFLEIPRVQGAQVRETLAGTVGIAPGEQAGGMSQGGLPRGNPEAKNGQGVHNHTPHTLLKTSLTARHPIVNTKTNDYKLILAFGQGNSGP